MLKLNQVFMSEVISFKSYGPVTQTD